MVNNNLELSESQFLKLGYVDQYVLGGARWSTQSMADRKHSSLPPLRNQNTITQAPLSRVMLMKTSQSEHGVRLTSYTTSIASAFIVGFDRERRTSYP